MTCDWKEYTLAELSIDNKGSYGIAASAVEYSKDKYTYLRITDITDDGRLSKNDLKSVDDINAKKYLLKQNDIVFARTGGSTGRNYFYDESDGELVFAGFLIKFSINPNLVNPKYIKYYCQSSLYKNWIHSFNTGSTRGNINAQTYGSMKITVPPRKQQNLLVKILSTIDDKIELNNKINENLEQQVFTLFNKNFPNINKGDKTIGCYIRPKRGKNLLSKNACAGKVPVVAGGLTPATYHNVSNTLAPVITISASGANAGFVNLWHIPVWSSDSSFIDTTITNNVYFWYVMLKTRQQEIFDSQTGSAQPHIYPQHIEVMPMTDIDIDLMNAYTYEVNSLFTQIGENLKENANLTQLHETLLPKLMSGEISDSNIDILDDDKLLFDKEKQENNGE